MDARPCRRALIDALWVLAAFALCPLVALLGPDDPVRAAATGHEIARLERDLGLLVEPGLARWAQAHLPGVLEAVELVYVWVHVPATVGALVWAWLERPGCFPRARDTFLATQALVVAGYLALPASPPRAIGLTAGGPGDPAGALGPASGLAHVLQSPYAAFPSGHVAFAVVAGGIVAALARPWWARALGVLYPSVVTAIVVVTLNHFWVDAVGGALAAAGGAWAARWKALRGEAPAPRLRPVRRDGAAGAQRQRPVPEPGAATS